MERGQHCRRTDHPAFTDAIGRDGVCTCPRARWSCLVRLANLLVRDTIRNAMRTHDTRTATAVKSQITVETMQMSTNSLFNWLLQQKSETVADEPIYVFGMFAKQLSSAAALYPKGKSKRHVELAPFVVPKDDHFNAVRELQKGFMQLTDDLVDAIVFSSVATKDTVRFWSDIDVFVIVKDDVINDVTRFVKFREAVTQLERHLYTFDPWQHHGFQFVMEADLQFYPEAFLPVIVLEQGASLVGGRSFDLLLRDSGRELESQLYGLQQLMVASAASGEMQHHCKNGVCLQDNFGTPQDNFYQLKYFVSLILLLPSLYIALVDAPVYKRESFARIRELFSGKDLELVTACEAVRSLFDTITPTGNAIPEQVLPVLGEHYFARAQELLTTLVQAYETHASA